MKHAKKFFALLLCATLFVGLTTPAFADEPAFTITADKQMVATGENFTLTAVNAPQAEAGQSIQYHWLFITLPENGHVGTISLGTTADAVIQIQAPGRDVLWPDYNNPFSQRFSMQYWCVVDISDASGLVASYRSSRITVQGYYNLTDSFAVPYEALGYALLGVFINPFRNVFYSIACLFGIVWSPFVALANSAQAKRVNG